MANFPTNPQPARIRIGSKYQSVESQTLSYNRQVASRGGHRWSFSLRYSPQTQSNFVELFAFLQSLKGRYGSCNFTLPNYAQQSTLSFESGFTTTQVAVQTSNGSLVKVKNADTGSVFRKGDFFKFSGHSKTYMITKDITVTESMVTGDDDIDLEFCPALQRQVGVDEDITIGATFKVAQASDEFFVDYPENKTYTTQIELREVVDSGSGGQSVY